MAEKLKVFTDDAWKIFEFADRSSLKNGRVIINTATLFDGVQRLFKLNTAYAADASKLSEIMGRYGINNKLFNRAMDDLYPASDTELADGTETQLSIDARNVTDCLKMKFYQEKASQTPIDVLVQLFSNKTYELYNVLTQVSNNMAKDYDEAVNNGVAEEDLPNTSFDVNLLYEDIRKEFVKQTVKTIKSLESDAMKAFLTNVNKDVAESSDKFIGMSGEMLAAKVGLAGRKKKCIVLKGKPGVGKTSLVRGLADAINRNDDTLPDFLRGTVIYELHIDALVAGSQFRGMFEQRLRAVLDAVSKLPNVLLFIDEFHTIIKAGSGGSDAGGDTNASNIMKPYISSGKVWIIGATTTDEYNEFVAKDKAIMRRFKSVLINEPSKEETIEIMKGTLPINEDFFKKTLDDGLLERIYTLSEQYDIGVANPDKALTMLESGYAYARTCHQNAQKVTLEDVVNAIALEYDLDISPNKAEATRKELMDKLLGQEKPLSVLSDHLDNIESGIVDPMKPKGVFFFAGPTGTGKTEACKILAKKMCGNEKKLYLVQGSTLMSETGVNTLFGADAGYIGYKQTSDFLAWVKQNPDGIILFDEIEKAHEAVFKSLLGILDEGGTRDKGGNFISFRGNIIIFTSNLGFGKSAHQGSGMLKQTHTSDSAIEDIKKHFSPEFMARLDDIIIFNRLSPKIIDKLINRYLDKYNKQAQLNIEFTPSDIRKIKQMSDIQNQGARIVEHSVKHMIGVVNRRNRKDAE